MNKLKGLMREKGVTQTMIAEVIGKTLQNTNAKLNGRAIWNLNEVIKICDYLEIDEPDEYFFTHKIPKTQRKQ